MHPANVPNPIVVKLSGSITRYRFSQLQNVKSPILFTPSSIITSFKPESANVP